MELEEQIKIAVEGCDVLLYDIVKAKENNDNIFRVYISSKDGINLDKCQEVSNMISPILDIHEPMRGKYRLEVSSPGIERKLTKKEHFLGSIGENIKGKEYSTETFKGKLLSFENDILTLQYEDSNETFDIKYDDILSASTYYNWKK